MKARLSLKYFVSYCGKNFERDQKLFLLSLDFDEISENFREEETIKIFMQDSITKVSFCKD